MRVITVPCLRDNYAYLVVDDNGLAAVVDPGEAAPVEAALRAENLQLAAIWLTHHHYDHVGGVADLLAAHPDVAVVAHRIDAKKITGVTLQVEDGEVVHCGNLRAEIIHNPGHTLGAISFLVDNAVFTGDTLFGAGCGRLFEGTADQLCESLARLAALPPQTLVYFGHEYTASNLVFAAAAWPNHPPIAARAAQVNAAHMSVPSTIADERATNPFMAVHEPAVVAAVQQRTGNGQSVFAALRQWKNEFAS